MMKGFASAFVKCLLAFSELLYSSLDDCDDCQSYRLQCASTVAGVTVLRCHAHTLCLAKLCPQL